MASEKIKNMSDEELEQMGRMAGMNFDPKLVRMASDQFTRMSDTERERMANMVTVYALRTLTIKFL